MNINIYVKKNGQIYINILQFVKVILIFKLNYLTFLRYNQNRFS